MTKLLAVSFTLFLLCGPALADPPPATFKVGVTVAWGKEVRRYAVHLVDHQCGIRAKPEPATLDEIKLCVESEDGGALVRVDWLSRQGPRELSNDSKVIVARGGSVELEGGAAKLTVSLL